MPTQKRLVILSIREMNNRRMTLQRKLSDLKSIRRNIRVREKILIDEIGHLSKKIDRELDINKSVLGLGSDQEYS